MNNKTICIDFDATVASYSGWTREGYAKITGKPLPGAKEVIESLRSKGWTVLIHSTRCSTDDGKAAVIAYLNKYDIEVDGVRTCKPPADLYLDDKAIQFNGDWTQVEDDIQKFKHWEMK